MKTILDKEWINRIGCINPRERVFVPKGYGWEEWLANSPLYCLKKIFIKQGRRNSWHYHKLKDETFLVVSGKVLIDYSMADCLMEKSIVEGRFDGLTQYPDEGDIMVYGAPFSILEPGDVFHVPVGLRHRFTGMQDSLLIEASTQHFDNDSIRLLPGD